MTTITLTTSNDTVVSSSADLVVNTTAATLNDGDQLTADGTGTLALYGSGTFRVDQLATFSGFSDIVFNNYTYDPRYLYLGNQSVAVTGAVSGSEQIYLGSGQTTYNAIGGFGNYTIISGTSSDWNSANKINGGWHTELYLNWNGEANASYDLTANTFHNITSLWADGDNLTLKINSATASAVTTFYGNGTNGRFVTSDSTLDLSHSAINGAFSVASTNTTGTTFTVRDVSTAFKIVGGAGQDTITASGFTFTAYERDAIFATASIEKVIDSTGTYTALPPAPNVSELTIGNDTVVSSSADLVVNATAATLNSGDQLTADGTGTLALYFGGTFGVETFRVDQLATFSGFSDIVLNNYANLPSYLYLGNQSVTVTNLAGGDRLYTYLGSGQTTYNGGSGFNSIISTTSSNWNSANEINGGSDTNLGGSDTTLHLNFDWEANASYDLTANTFHNIRWLSGGGDNLTLKINNATASAVSYFYGGGTNGRLVTSDSTLDLSHSSITGFTVASINTTGTTFTVKDVATAVTIFGGTGQDAITASGFTFTADERNAIFATASIEKIVDQSGTYTIPVLANAIADQNLPEDAAWTFTVPADTFSDVDGDALTYTASLADGSVLPEWLSFDAATRIFSGTPPANFNGQIAFKVTASDSSATASDSFTLNVTAINDAPIVNSNSGGDTASVSNAENTTAVTVVTATDPDAGQALSYSISGGADADKFTIDSNTGALRFITAPNFEAPTDVGGNNIYDVTVQVSDGYGGMDTQAIAVTVTNANDAPAITSSGGGATAIVSVAENSTAVTTVTAIDPDAGQALSYSISGGADAAKFTIDSNTGTLSFITAPNFETPTDVDGNNVYDVTVQISDGLGGVDTQAIAVKVENVVGVSIMGTPSNDLIDATHTVAGQPLPINEEDTLAGGAGADRMSGGQGSDVYFVDNFADAVFENAGEGTDTVNASIHYTLTADVETLVLQGSADLQAYGNSLNNTIVGNSGSNLLNGFAGADTMSGGAGDDLYFVDDAGDAATENASEGNDTVFATAHFGLSANVENLILQGGADLQGYGNAQANVIYGNTGSNLLNGFAAADLMVGGAGNDIYFVDDASDAAFELAGEGNDTVFATAHSGLAANVENLILQGSANLQGYGNNQANVIYGNSGNNLLNAAAGVDLMVGGMGDDTYFVDDSSDSAFENAGEGNDAVFASAHYGLAADVETLVLQGSADLQGYGSNQVNTLYGNIGNNLLNGAAGADIMVGGLGNDTYFVDDIGDLVFENLNEGSDAVFATVSHTLAANVETLVLQGSGNLSGRGNALANQIFGNIGANTIDGGGGVDQLTGDAGNDTFVFHAGQANGDAVVDFVGNGAAVGDSLSFVGFGTAAQGATFMQVGATNQWQIHSGLDAHNEFITFSNGAAIDPNDFLFG